MVTLEKKNCNVCKKEYPPKVFWQKYCSDECHDAYWRGVYTEKSVMNKRLEEVEKKVGIK